MIYHIFILNVICLILNVVGYLLIEKKKISSILRYSVSLALTLIFIFFIGDIPSFIIEDSELILENFNFYIIDVLMFNISILLFSSSILLFIIGFVKLKSPIIEFKQPSIGDSRKGEIKIGKIIKPNSFDYSFYLSLEDLEKHMFICGSTGTGKSNFLQHFLINFVKKVAFS